MPLKLLLRDAVLILGFAALTTSTHASLVGQVVEGSLKFEGYVDEFFVPNSAVIGPGVEFSAEFPEGPLSADFTGNSLTITNSFENANGTSSVASAHLRFTPDTPDLFDLFSLLSSDQPNGILIGLQGDTLQVTILGGDFERGVYTTTIGFAITEIPEPGGLALAFTALLALIRLRRAVR